MSDSNVFHCTVCWFCDERPSELSSAALVVVEDPSGEHGSEDADLGIRVPRCPSCKSAHVRARFLTGLPLGLGLFGRLMAERLLRGIMPESYKLTFPSVQAAEQQGWIVQRPPLRTR